MSLCSIIRVKSFPPCWSGQKEDICPSIKKSMHYLTCLYNSLTFTFFLTWHFSSHIFMYMYFEGEYIQGYLLYILCNICIFVTKTWHVLIIHLGTFTFFQTWHFPRHIFIYTLKASTSKVIVCSILCNICIFGTKTVIDAI